MQLSKRLQAVADMVGEADCLADVGTDHGYVPIYLAEKGKIQRAIAMDINPGPLMRAQEHIRAHALTERIETRLSDGVKELIKGEADAVVVAGMGGALTIRILTEGRQVLEGVNTIVLQPQSEIASVRKYLYENGYFIESENMVLDEGKYYPMMRARRGWKQGWEKTEYAYGKYLIENRSPVLASFLDKEETACQQVLEALNGREGDRIDKRRREVLEQCERIREAKERIKR